MTRKAILSHISSHTLFNILANLFRILAGSLVLVYIARQLGPTQFGIVSLGLSIAAIIDLFCDFGISTSTSRFLADNTGFSSDIYKNGFSLNLILSLIFSLALFFLAKPISEVVNIDSPAYVQIICVITLFTGLFQFSIRSLQGIKKTDKVALLNFLQNIITNIFIFIIVYIGYKAKGVLVGQSASVIIIWIISLIVLNRYFRINGAKLNIHILKKIFFYALPLLLTSGSYFLSLRGPIILLSAYAGTDEVSYLNIPMRIIELISLPVMSVATVTSPFFVKRESSAVNYAWLYTKILKYSLLFYIPAAVYLALCASRIINLVFGPVYKEAVAVLIIFSFYLPFFAIATFTSRILDFLGMAKQKSIVFAITAVSTIFSSLIIAPLLHAVGVALVIAVPYTVYSIYTIVKSSNECGVKLVKYLTATINLIVVTVISCLPTILILHCLKGFTGLIISFLCFITLFFTLGVFSKLIRITELRSLLNLFK